MKRLLALALAILPAGFGQQRVEGPVLGFVFDAQVRLRPILGIPGSSLLGRPVYSNPAARLGAVSPQQDFALVAEGESGRLVLLTELAGAPVSRTIEALGNATRIAISPGGAYVAVYSAGEGRVRVAGGFPAGPAEPEEFPAAGLVELAVSDTGAAVAVIEQAGRLDVVALQRAGGRVLVSTGAYGGMAFLHGRDDLLVADRELDTLALVRGVTTGGAAEALANRRDGIAGPREVAVSLDNRYAFVANQATPGVLVVDLEGGAARMIPTDAAPSRLARLRGNAVFRLTEAEDQPLWLLDAGPPQPRLVFVAAEAGGER